MKWVVVCIPGYPEEWKLVRDDIPASQWGRYRKRFQSETAAYEAAYKRNHQCQKRR